MTDTQIIQMSQFISNVHSEKEFDQIYRFVKHGLTNEQIEKFISKPNWHINFEYREIPRR
jgi:hypothetical protein